MADVGQPLLPDSLSQFTQGARFLVELARPKRRFFSVQLSLLQASSQRFFLFVFWDITQTEELELLKSQLVSTVAHRLRPRSTSIQGFQRAVVPGIGGFDEGLYTSTALVRVFVRTY